MQELQSNLDDDLIEKGYTNLTKLPHTPIPANEGGKKKARAQNQ